MYLAWLLYVYLMTHKEQHLYQAIILFERSTRGFNQSDWTLCSISSNHAQVAQL